MSGSKQISLVDTELTIVEYSGQINGETIFESGIEHRITGDATVPNGSHLHIAAGARLMFAEDVNLTVNGRITSNGTPSDPVHIASVSDAAWGGIRIRNGNADFRFTFFTNGGGDATRAFGHSNSQPVLFADAATLNCDNCFVLYNEGKGIGSTNNSQVNLHQSIISNSDTGGEFVRSVVQVTETYVKDIPNDDQQFVDDDTVLSVEGIAEVASGAELRVVGGGFIVTDPRRDRSPCRIVESGLQIGERVIVNGIQRVRPGMTVQPIPNMVNHETNELFFDNLEIPAENLIGEEGQGFKYAMAGLGRRKSIQHVACEISGPRQPCRR